MGRVVVDSRQDTTSTKPMPEQEASRQMSPDTQLSMASGIEIANHTEVDRRAARSYAANSAEQAVQHQAIPPESLPVNGASLAYLPTLAQARVATTEAGWTGPLPRLGIAYPASASTAGPSGGGGRVTTSVGPLFRASAYAVQRGSAYPPAGRFTPSGFVPGANKDWPQQGMPLASPPGSREPVWIQTQGDSAGGPTGATPRGPLGPTAELPTMTASSANEAASAADTKQLAEQVYEILVQRLSAERERRGW